MTQLHCGGRDLDLSRPVVMGVLNVTPDSFSDGGRYVAIDAALRLAEKMCQDGAGIIDVGGESTRPGAAPVSSNEELDRVMPVVEAIHQRFDVIISLDTSTPALITAGASAGAGLINDVRALQRPGALAAAAATSLPICLMHMQGEPDTMQLRPHYDSVCDEVMAFLRERAEACINAGMAAERLLYDPGFGFGKTLSHNLSLLKHFERLHALGGPLLVGMSRKSMLGQVLGGAAVDARAAAGLAAAVLAVERGARIIRTHDVRETADALALWQAQSQE